MLLLHDKPENGKVGGKEELYQIVQFLTTAAPENTMVHHLADAEFKLNPQYQTWHQHTYALHQLVYPGHQNNITPVLWWA